jgi:hypothetical protein
VRILCVSFRPCEHLSVSAILLVGIFPCEQFSVWVFFHVSIYDSGVFFLCRIFVWALSCAHLSGHHPIYKVVAFLKTQPNLGLLDIHM